MSKVALRVYNREIETMIEGGRLDEAVAHCQNILKTFPMHVETYRLLGKSFLEARRYTDAADIFQRTLMAVPDDFVAHVGMSIIRDDEGKLDDAIWHMERAFEDQPSNLAIQSELRRLYGRRDGIEPPKIRLSRDALANMYAQGGLFTQAIAEIRAVLAEDPNRADLQVMLTRAYYRAGQKVEAAEVAANLLKKYSFCLDALRVLVDVLPEESQTENTQVYRQRLHLLDPYSSFVSGSVFGSDQVGDGSVNVDRLEYVAGAAPASPQPNWATTLGIKLAEEKPIEPTPPWQTTGTDKKTPATQQESTEPEPTPSENVESIPDWMQNVGWKESAGNVPEAAMETLPEKPAEPLDNDEMPDWLKSLEPRGKKPEAPGTLPLSSAPPAPEAGDVPEWLTGLGTIQAEEPQPEVSLSPATPKDTNIFPDWLKEMDAGKGQDPDQAPAPDKLEDSGQPEISVPDQPAAPSTEVFETSMPQPTVPAWGVDTPFQPTGEAKPLNIEDDAMAWLENLAAKQGAKEEELLIKPENRSGDMPDWLRPESEQAPAAVPMHPSAPLRETLPLEPFNLPGNSQSEPAGGPATEIFPAEGEVAAEQPQDIFADEKPSWLGGAPAKEEPAKSPEMEVHSASLAEEIPPIVPAIIPSPPLNIGDDREAWLKDLATTESETLPEELPSLHDTAIEGFPPSEPAEEPSQTLSTEADTEAWLKGLSALDERDELKESQPLASAFIPEVPPQAAPDVEPVQPFSLEEKSIPGAEEPGSLQEMGVSEELSSQPISPNTEVPSVEPQETPVEPYRIDNDRGGWQEELASTPAKPEEEETLPLPTSTSPEVPTGKPAASPTPPFNVGDDTDAWLEGLPLPEKKPSLDEIPPATVEPPAAPPDWIQTPTPEPPAQDKPVATEGPMAPLEDDITITSWLNKHDVEAALMKARSNSQAAPVEDSPAADLPDWLKESETVTTPETESKSDEKMPEWLSETVPLTDIGTGKAPVSEQPVDQELPPGVDETLPAPEPLEHTASEEWMPVEEQAAQPPDIASTDIPAPADVEPPIQRQILGGTGMLSRIPPEDKDAEFLSAAQTALDSKQIKESMHAYSKLIKKNRLLDEVIHDLREAIYRFPVDIQIWQTLGDASMRANRLQDALDAYTKAEELLR